MGRTRWIGAACLPLLLAACDDRRTPAADAKICQPFTAATAGAGPLGGEAAHLDDCLHRSAYRLARAEDGAETVAAAVVASCSDSLSRWNTSTVNGPNAADSGGETTDLITGQSASAIAHRYAFTQGRALYYVVQARAGHCAVPDAATAR